MTIAVEFHLSIVSLQIWVLLFVDMSLSNELNSHFYLCLSMGSELVIEFHKVIMSEIVADGVIDLFE